MAELISHARLANALLQLVREQQFEQVADAQSGGKPVVHFPSLDLAVVAFPPGASPVWANVLFSRDFPQGVIARIDDQAGAVANIQYLNDQTAADGTSLAWSSDSDWSAIEWTSLGGTGAQRFVSPYPASLIKLMVAIGVARVVDTGAYRWESLWDYAGTAHTIAQWTDSMVVASNNDATSAMVALLHVAGLIQRSGDQEINGLNSLFQSLGMHTLRLSDTRPDGGWRNADGAGVGHLHMTAWDTVRLLWLISEGLPPAPWQVQSETPLLQAESRQLLWQMLGDQGLHEILSSTALAGVAGWQVGIPAVMPGRWVQSDGSAQVETTHFPPDIRPAHAKATALFAHKTGTTDNYAADAGLVTGLVPQGRRYCIALTTNLGRRYAPHPNCATDWRVPRLGAAIDTWLQERLE